MTFEEAKADWLATLAAHPGAGYIPSIGAWANMCDMERREFERRCTRSHPVEVARHRLFRVIYAEERRKEYQRLRAEGVPRLEAFNRAGISGDRAREIEPPTKVFHDWPALWASVRDWLAEPRTTHDLAARMGVDPRSLHNHRARGLPRWLGVEKVGAFLWWQAKKKRG